MSVTLEHIYRPDRADPVELGWNTGCDKVFTMKLNYRRGMIKEEVSTGQRAVMGPEEKVAHLWWAAQTADQCQCDEVFAQQ